MKIAVAGKGGAGKTTLTAALARAYAKASSGPRGAGRVVAVDADPNNCLGLALGFPPEVLAGLTPLSEMKDLLAERSGLPDASGKGGSMFLLNPRVDDLLARFAVEHDGISLLVMGTVTKAGGGCLCPENSVLRALVRELLFEEGAVVLLDLEAGLEHLGRATAEFVDAMLIVSEPTSVSLQTAGRIAELAAQINLPTPGLVGNKVSSEAAAAFLREHADPLPVLGILPYVEELAVGGPVRLEGPFGEEIARIKGKLEGEPQMNSGQSSASAFTCGERSP